MSYGKIYPISDLRIRVAIQNLVHQDPALRASEVQVFVEEAEVSLQGVVWTSDDFRRAEQMAASVDGVMRVRNKLAIGPQPAA
jgi:osmotically-inducible protein OsmY